MNFFYNSHPAEMSDSVSTSNDHPLTRRYREACDTCFCRVDMDEKVPPSWRIYHSESCYAFNDLYDQINILREIKKKTSLMISNTFWRTTARIVKMSIASTDCIGNMRNQYLDGSILSIAFICSTFWS